MIINWEEDIEMFLEPFSKSSCSFTNILLITFHPFLLVSINCPTFLNDGVFFFWIHQDALDSFFSFEVYLYAIFFHTLLKLSMRPLVFCTTIHILVLFVVCLGLSELFLVVVFTGTLPQLKRVNMHKDQRSIPQYKHW